MKKLILAALMACGALQGFGAYYVAGDFNGWDAAGQEMIETASGSGIYAATVLSATGRHEFKVTDGTWSWSVPGPNSWFYTDDSGAITLSFDTNVYADGWLPETNRLGVSYDTQTWAVAGGFNGWNNNDAGTVMSNQGGGVFYLETLMTAGMQEFKPIALGSWDSLSVDGRTVNTSNMSINLSQDSLVGIWVDTLNGTVKVEAVPEPATMLGLAFGAGALLMRRRRK